MILSLLRNRLSTRPSPTPVRSVSVTQLLRELEYRSQEEIDVVVDLSDAQELTSQELSRIVHLHLAYQDGGKRLILANAKGKVAETIAITRLGRTVALRNLELTS